MVDLDSLPPQDCISSVMVSPDGAWVVSGSDDHSVQFWNLKDAQAQFMLQGDEYSVTSIDLSPAGGLLATSSDDQRVRVCEWLICICLCSLLFSPKTFGMLSFVVVVDDVCSIGSYTAI